MKVLASCFCYDGAPVWHGTKFFEPVECQWTGIIDVDGDEWEDGCVHIACPNCGTTLWQCDDHFEKIAEKLKREK